jgi:hypothetical protein
VGKRAITLGWFQCLWQTKVVCEVDAIESARVMGERHGRMNAGMPSRDVADVGKRGKKTARRDRVWKICREHLVPGAVPRSRGSRTWNSRITGLIPAWRRQCWWSCTPSLSVSVSGAAVHSHRRQSPQTQTSSSSSVPDPSGKTHRRRRRMPHRRGRRGRRCP